MLCHLPGMLPSLPPSLLTWLMQLLLQILSEALLLRIPLGGAPLGQVSFSHCELSKFHIISFYFIFYFLTYFYFHIISLVPSVFVIVTLYDDFTNLLHALGGVWGSENHLTPFPCSHSKPATCIQQKVVVTNPNLEGGLRTFIVLGNLLGSKRKRRDMNSTV